MNKYFNQTDLSDHRFLLHINLPKHNLYGFIAIHRGGNTIPSFGATRFQNYLTKQEALEDALRLSKLMSYKAAIANLQYGGAKAVLISNKNTKKDISFLKTYAKQVDKLDGMFITGADIGISPSDIKKLKKLSSNFVGVTRNPVEHTVNGIFEGIKIALQHKYSSTDLSKRSVAIQGLGKIGVNLLKKIYNNAKHIFVADTNEKVLKITKKSFPDIKIVPSDEIHTLAVDVFSPCAVHHSINEETIKQLQCNIIAGGANNQLSSEKDGKTLITKDILFAPDYVINGGGLISVVDEYENPNDLDLERLEKKLTIIPKRLETIFEQSKKTGIATNLIANQIAEEAIKKNHE